MRRKEGHTNACHHHHEEPRHSHGSLKAAPIEKRWALRKAAPVDERLYTVYAKGTKSKKIWAWLQLTTAGIRDRIFSLLSMLSPCVNLPNGFQIRLKMHRLDAKCEQSHKMRACVQASAWAPHVRFHPLSTQTQHLLDNMSLCETSKDIRKRAYSKATSPPQKRRYGRLTTAHATVPSFIFVASSWSVRPRVVFRRFSLKFSGR